MNEQMQTIQQLRQLQASITYLKQGFDEKLEQMMKGFEALPSAQTQPSTVATGNFETKLHQFLGLMILVIELTNLIVFLRQLNLSSLNLMAETLDLGFENVTSYFLIMWLLKIKSYI